MDRARLTRHLQVFIGVLLLLIGGVAGPAAGQTTVVVNSVAGLEAALATAATTNSSTTIRIAAGTYNIASPLFLDALPGVTVTLESAGAGPVILHSTSSAAGSDVLRTGWNSQDNGALGPFPGFVVRGLTFSGADIAINSAVGTILVADSTFVDNNLGFYVDFSRATVELVNNTFTQNGARCPTNFFCGGMRFDFHRSSTVTNSTVVGNQPQGIGGDLRELVNSIVTGNTAPLGTRGADCFNVPATVGNSIDSDGSCAATTVDPQLAALADNGGLVQTMALPAGSPAVNAGNSSVCPLSDARGAFRGDGACDIGAFERSQAFQAESVTGAGPVAFSTDVGTFTEFHAVDPTTLPPLPGVTFPFGLFEWTISDLTPGDPARVIIQFPAPVPELPQYWKFDPGTGLWADVCQQLACVTGGPVFPNLLQLTITDGGPGDLDGSVNGMIRDPGGLGVSEGGGGDTTRPTIVAPPDVTAETGPGATTCSAVVDPGVASASDDSGSVTISPPLVPDGNVFPVGVTIVVHTATDPAGNQSSAVQSVTVNDTTPPVVPTPPDVTVNATSPAGAVVTYPLPAATDNCPGVSVTGAPPSGSAFAIGTTIVTVTATDAAGNRANTTFQVTVNETLTFLGFQPPIREQALNTGQKGRTYPVKFQIQDLSGQFVSDLSAVRSITVQPVSCAMFEGDPSDEIPATATGGTGLRYDLGANQFVFNWQTPGVAGCYQLRVTLADGGVHSANFQLR
jgi:hypothetical protein